MTAAQGDGDGADLWQLALSEEDVATERDVILEERRSRVDNDPGSILQEQMMAALYASIPTAFPS
jgi:zinc protease